MCEFFHIPFQSGDDNILREMRCVNPSQYRTNQERCLRHSHPTRHIQTATLQTNAGVLCLAGLYVVLSQDELTRVKQACCWQLV